MISLFVYLYIPDTRHACSFVWFHGFDNRSFVCIPGLCLHTCWFHDFDNRSFVFLVCLFHDVDHSSQVMEAFQAAEKDVAEKTGELKEISVAYEKAKSLADKIRGVEVDITLQLQEYAKVFTRGFLETFPAFTCASYILAYTLFAFYYPSIACEGGGR